MNRSPYTSTRAMTIVEVCIAATVVLIGVVGLIQALTIGAAMLETSRSQTLAAQIIQHEIGQLRLLDWDDTGTSTANADILALTTDASYTLLSAKPATHPFKTVAPTFGVKKTVSNVQTDLRRVVLSVQWTSKVTGRVYTRTGETYLGKNGLHASY
ncbi:MAG TPA: hypothetical protein VGD88_01175 [Opitutaceae bacterium]